MTDKTLQLKLNNELVDISTPIVMGILNITPDSFYKGNRIWSDKHILNKAEDMLSEGAMILDIGGYSTRPSADFVSQNEEIKRISTALEIILKEFPTTKISIDTFRSGVVRYAKNNYPISMINDISGGTMDDLMFETVADTELAYVLMHTRGNPQTMQQQTQYEDIVAEVLTFLEKRLKQLHLLGVNDVIVDPGFGFAKTLEQNFILLNKLSYFKELNTPILAGLSRKSMLYKTIESDPEGSLNATTAANMLALVGGANILRVHDVKEAIQTISIFNQYNI